MVRAGVSERSSSSSHWLNDDEGGFAISGQMVTRFTDITADTGSSVRSTTSAGVGTQLGPLRMLMGISISSVKDPSGTTELAVADWVRWISGERHQTRKTST